MLPEDGGSHLSKRFFLEHSFVHTMRACTRTHTHVHAHIYLYLTLPDVTGDEDEEEELVAPSYTPKLPRLTVEGEAVSGRWLT